MFKATFTGGEERVQFEPNSQFIIFSDCVFASVKKKFSNITTLPNKLLSKTHYLHHEDDRLDLLER
jgi:hypothetical protein